MKSLKIYALALILVLGLAASAWADLYANLWVNNEIFQIPIMVTTSSDMNVPGNPTAIVGSDFTGSAWIKVDPDPAVAYGLSFTSGANPLSLTFVFAGPAFVINTPSLVKASISGGLTDIDGLGVSLLPFQNPLIQTNTALLNGAPVGVPWGVGAGYNFGPGGPGAKYTFQTSMGPNGGPPPIVTGMNETVSFTLSGGGDIASFTGYCAIDPVPVPGSVLLMGSGLLGLVGLRWRRRAV
jgi:hypothetical protein